MGMYCEVTAASREDFSGANSGAGVSLEKAWHGLHYLLTGEVWEGEGPLAFLLAGGEQLGDEEAPVRWFTPEETNRIHQALARVSEEDLWSRFDAEELTQQEVYPGIWDEPEADLKDEYLGYFRELRQVVSQAAEHGQGLMVSIG